MSQKNQPENPVNGIDELNENLVTVTEKVQNNQKIIMWCSLAVAAVVAIVLIYVYLIHEPGKAKSNDEIGKADIQLAIGNDSVALAQYINVADNYGHAASNRAALQAACLLYEQGDYEQALKYVDKYSADESIIGAAAKSLAGDCYVNTDQLDKAISCYKSAISASDKNPLYTPFFMMKLARVYREQKNFAEEAKLYQEIENNYPEYGQAYGIDVQKLLKRAQFDAKN